MKINILILSLFLLSLGSIFNISCTSYLENPLIDKETGEEIDLLVIDASVFPVRLQISLIDSISGAAFEIPATVSFSGKNANDIITLSGKKQHEFHTSTGFIELAVDPNVAVSETEPLRFSIHVKTGEHQETAKEFVYDSGGIKKIELKL